MSAIPVASLDELVENGIVQLTRGKIISKKDIAECPGDYPIYSSAKDNDGKFGEYGSYLFDEELITWSVDGGGRLFHRPRHKFSVTNVGGVLRILDASVIGYRYLYYALTLRHSQIAFDWVKKAHPSVIRKLYTGIPIPPLPEQQRIVALLDEAFAGLATAKANAERNLQNARAVFESQLESVFANQWQTHELVRLADLATDITDGDHQPPPKSSIGVPFITIRNILKGSREIDFSDTFTVPRDYFDALKAHKKPRQGDVLYTVTGSFGIPVIVRDDAEFCFQRHIALVRPRAEISSSWLYYLLMSPQLFKKACDGATGTAQKTVSLTLLRSFAVPKVSSQQQRQSAEKLDALSAETQRLTHLYERKLAALEELKKSLLQQAFNGEL